MSPFRKIVFGFIAIVGVPALFFVVIEQGLRLAGVGKAYDFFSPITINKQAYYQDNPSFAGQFYPAEFGLVPLKTTFPESRDTGTLRVFVLGGSAARGFPNPDHGFSRHLELLLRDALPGRRIQVVNTAMTSMNSHVVYETARSIPEGTADFAIILMGNNEVVGPYGPGTFSQNFMSQLKLIRGAQAAKRLRIGQLIQSAAAQLQSAGEDKDRLYWMGMQMFTENNVPFSDARLDAVYSHYEQNLDDIVSLLKAKGAHVLLSSVPVNLHDSAPFASQHDPDLADDDLAAWEQAVSSGESFAEAQGWGGAIAAYQRAIAIDPVYADTHFQLAMAYEASEDFQRASTHLEKARDLDTLRFRADSQIDARIRKIASKHAGNELTFVDNVAAFDRVSQPRRPGWNLFLEHVHFDFAGDYLLATEFLGAILDQLGVDDYTPPPPAELAARMDYPGEGTVAAMSFVLKMVESPPFTGQSNHAELQEFINAKNSETEEQVGSISDQIERKRALVASGKSDWRVAFELAELAEKTGNSQYVAPLLSTVLAENPHHRESQMMMARILHREGKFREEIPYLEQALNYTRGDRDLVSQIVGWLGLAHYRLGEQELGADYLLQVARNYPDKIHVTLQAYGTLIKYSAEAGRDDEVERYADELQRYADGIRKSGREDEYPRFRTRMTQIMRIAGREA